MFFLYWEEVDLCKRVQDLGFQVWATGKAVAHHIGGASSSSIEATVHGCIPIHFYQSRYYYMTKHFGWVAATLADVSDFFFNDVADNC